MQMIIVITYLERSLLKSWSKCRKYVWNRFAADHFIQDAKKWSLSFPGRETHYKSFFCNFLLRQTAGLSPTSKRQVWGCILLILCMSLFLLLLFPPHTHQHLFVFQLTGLFCSCEQYIHLPYYWHHLFQVKNPSTEGKNGSESSLWHRLAEKFSKGKTKMPAKSILCNLLGLETFSLESHPRILN